MSAALQLPILWGAGCTLDNEPAEGQPLPLISRLAPDPRQKKPVLRAEAVPQAKPVRLPQTQAGHVAETGSLVFYRKHTERLLRRYLYASMQVGRSPSILSDPVARGWVSSRPIRSFEDAVIFVLDVERCLDKLSPLDRQMISRVVLQEYTQAETAALVGMSTRSFTTKFAMAMDRLTARLLESGVLVLPE